jgi:hypothetical protein
MSLTIAIILSLTCAVRGLDTSLTADSLKPDLVIHEATYSIVAPAVPKIGTILMPSYGLFEIGLRIQSDGTPFSRQPLPTIDELEYRNNSIIVTIPDFSK